MIKHKKRSFGFTLIELLVVIGILAILLAITLIAINPARQFSQANNTKRSSDVNAILNAINQYMADNSGQTPAGIPVAPALAVEISNAGADICSLLVSQYIAALPADPLTNNGQAVSSTGCTAAGGYVTGYEVIEDANGRITVLAPGAELGATIAVTR